MKIEVIGIEYGKLKFLLDGKLCEATKLSSRYIYIGETFVIKFSYKFIDDDYEDMAGCHEPEYYAQLEPEDEKYFPKLLHVGDGYVVMEKKQLSEPDNDTIRTFTKLIQNLIDKYNLRDIDIYGHNWAIADDLPCVYDCGGHFNLRSELVSI